MKKMIILLSAILLLCSACTTTEPTTEEAETPSATEAPTINRELMPDVYDDVSAFVEAGQIELSVPAEASEVTQVILYDEISQMQFVYNGVFYTYRAAFASTGRTGSKLTDIVEETNYLEDEMTYENMAVDYTFEAHLLDGGSLLLWSDGEINYSLASFGGTFEGLCNVADLIIK